MSADFISDLDAVDPSTVETVGPIYPVAQWMNGDPKMVNVGGVVHTGGIALPVRYLEEGFQPAPGWVYTTIAFSTGQQENMLVCQKSRLAVIRSRFRWIVERQGVETYYPREAYVDNVGMKGHLQVLCRPFGFKFPIVITFKGMGSKAMGQAALDFGNKALVRANKITAGTGREFPRFAFYMTIKAGQPKKVGQKNAESVITPPVLELPEAVTDDYLRTIYVGRDSLLQMSDDYHVAEQWATAWGKNAEPKPVEEAEEEEPDYGPSMTAAQLSQPTAVPQEDAFDKLEREEAAKAQAIDPARAAGPAGFVDGPARTAELKNRLAGAPAGTKQTAGPVVPHPGPVSKPGPSGSGPKPAANLGVTRTGPPEQHKNIKGFIQDGPAWKSLLDKAIAIGYEHGFHVQGVLKNAGWTSYGRGQEADAMSVLMKHATESKDFDARHPTKK